jgi:tetratricopeptide (TPR) repeat protein
LIFIVLSFLAWLRARDSETSSQWRFWHGLTVVLALLGVLSKPVAVIVPALFIAYEFCSAPHIGLTHWRWSTRRNHPLLTRAIMLTAVFLFTGVASAIVFRRLLERSSMHGGWLIFVSLALALGMLGLAPSKLELAALREGRSYGMRSMAPPFVVLSAVFGAGVAWTFWAQQQVGAIKGGLTLLPTLNLSFEVMLAYAAKTLVPAFMSASYTWSSYPYVSVTGFFGAVLIGVAVWAAMRLSGSQDRNRRLIAFGIFWYLIALIPVSNLVPTSTQMADRYLFVPSVGAILALVSTASVYLSFSRRSQSATLAGFALVILLYAGWAHGRTEVWCGKTALWKGRPQPDLSLWTSAVETDADNATAQTFLGLAYLRLSPPDADTALLHLNRAMQVSEESQGKIAGDRQLILTHVYSALGDGYLVKASQLGSGDIGSLAWLEKEGAYRNAVKYFDLASKSPSGFASSDARVCSRLAEACEGKAQMDAQELANAPMDQRIPLIAERDQLRSKSEDTMNHAREFLISGNVPAIDPDYRTVILEEGNIIFGREVGVSSSAEKVGYYRRALLLYQKAASLLPDDPRPWLYQGLCYERLTGIASSEEDKRQEFTLGESALRKALTLNVDSPDYSPALPHQALASLYAHVGDFRSALDSLKSARQAGPIGPESAHLDAEIRSVEQYMENQHTAN